MFLVTETDSANCTDQIVGPFYNQALASEWIEKNIKKSFRPYWYVFELTNPDDALAKLGDQREVNNG